MTPKPNQPGLDELRNIRKQSRGLYWIVGVFSFFANMLMLTGPLYMLQVYDRVLGSRSVETLVALSLLVAFLYGVMGVLDFTRGRIMGRVGARFQAGLDRRVFNAMLSRSSVANDPAAQTGLADLESVQRLIGSPVLMAAFDLPWAPVFLAGIFLFHPWLGLLAIAGGALLVLIALLNQTLSKRPLTEAAQSAHRATLMSSEIRTEAEMIQSMGMRGAAFDRWQVARDHSLLQSVQANDVVGSFTAMTKTLRMFLQSAMLGLGAFLVLRAEVSAGAMIASSILLGRALAPIELALGQWATVQRAAKGWHSLSGLLSNVPQDSLRTTLPAPRAVFEAKALTVVPPEESRPLLRSVSFRVEPGQALGVIGPSGAGKSTLARVLTGVWPATHGDVRLDGATLDQYGADTLGGYIGYLPQRVQMFEGTIAENIARLSNQPDSEKVVAAAKKAAAHDMIVQLPDGYNTRISAGGGRLSGGQMQRIALARALYDDPVVLILDEPNSNLDNDGSQALNQAIRATKAAGHAVLIMAHRPSALRECDLLLVLDKGAGVAFGPKNTVLKSTVANHEQVQQTKVMGGVR